MIRFITGKPALVVEDCLVLGDLHIGIEEKLEEKGIHVPNLSAGMGREVREIFLSSNVKKLVLLGDIKESIGYPTKLGYSYLKAFFDEIKGIDVVVVKGNHDAHLSEVFSVLGLSYKIEKELILRSTALAHGNAYPSKEALSKKYLIIGHGHAAYGPVGGSVEKVWVIASSARGKKLILVPAFNPMISGSNIRNWNADMGIIHAGSFNINEAKVYDLFGKPLGKVKELAKQDLA